VTSIFPTNNAAKEEI